jgi:hypothetical protein
LTVIVITIIMNAAGFTTDSPPANSIFIITPDASAESSFIPNDCSILSTNATLELPLLCAFVALEHPGPVRPIVGHHDCDATLRFWTFTHALSSVNVLSPRRKWKKAQEETSRHPELVEVLRIAQTRMNG